VIETLETLDRMARRFDVPLLDALFITMNACGAASEIPLARARMHIRHPESEEKWQLILPLNADSSPFVLRDDRMFLQDEEVCRIAGIENDDVVLFYLRASGSSLTLNTYSRSTCTGCLFCPNVIEDAADATLKHTDEMLELLEWVIADNDWTDLARVEVITICTGCFQTPEAAIQHMLAVKAAAEKVGFRGRLHLLSSVIRERADMERIAAELSPFHLTLTIECFTRRSLLLKESKASLTVDECCRILDDCAQLGVRGDFTYVVGLDPIDETIAGLKQLAHHATAFPRLQVYQAHNSYMRRARTADADSIEYFLKIRRSIENDYAAAGLAPTSWENYRPLWYTNFCGKPVDGPRI
jgi:hypothetical protein